MGCFKTFWFVHSTYKVGTDQLNKKEATLNSCHMLSTITLILCQLSDEWRVLESGCGQLWVTDKSMDNPLSVEWWVESIGVWMWSVVGYWQKYGQPSVSWVMSGEYWSLDVVSCGLLTKVWTTLCQLSDEWRVLESGCGQLWVTDKSMDNPLSVEWWVESIGVWMWSVVGYWQKYGQPSVSWVMSGEYWSLDVVSCGLLTKVWTTLCQLSDEWRVLESGCGQLWVTDKSMDNPLSVEWWVESIGVWMWSVVGYWQKYGQPSVSWVMSGEYWSLDVVSCGLLTKVWTTLCQLSDEWRVLESGCGQLWVTDKSMDNPLSVEWWVESIGVWMWSVVGYWQKYGQPSVSWVMSGEYWSLDVVSCGLLTKVWTTLCQLSDEWRVLESGCGQLWVTDKSMDSPLSVEWWVESIGVWMWSVVGYWQKYGQPSVSWVMSGEYWSLDVVSCGLLTKVWTTLCQLSDEWRVLESGCGQLWVTDKSMDNPLVSWVMSGEYWSLDVVSCGLLTKVWTTLCQLSDEWRVLESGCGQLWVTDKSMDNPLSVEWWVESIGVWMWSVVGYWQKYGQPSVSWVMSGEYWMWISCGLLTKVWTHSFIFKRTNSGKSYLLSVKKWRLFVTFLFNIVIGARRWW